MKKIFSGIFATLLFVSGITLAFNVQDDNPCTEEGHTGYTSATAPSLPFNPAAPLPSGMTRIENYGTDFRCQDNPPANCHWVYIPAEGQEPAKWVECRGDLELAPFEDGK